MVRKYNQVTDEQRQRLLQMIKTEKVTIKNAAERIGISYDNARAICSTFHRFNRLYKVTYQQRTLTRRANEIKSR